MIAPERRNVVFRAVPELNLLWDALRPMRRLLALRRCSHGSSVKLVALLCCLLANSRPSTMNSLFQVQLVMVHVFLRLAMCQQRPKWDAWEGESRPSSHVVWCRCRVKNQAQLTLEATSEVKWCWSRPLTMVIWNSNEVTFGLVPYGFLICWIV